MLSIKDTQAFKLASVSDFTFRASPDKSTIFAPPSINSNEPPLGIGAFLTMYESAELPLAELVMYTSTLIVDVTIFDNLIPIIASSEFDVKTVLAVVPILTSPDESNATSLSKSCAILSPFYYKATLIAITNPALAPADPLDADVILPFASTVILAAV